MKFAIIGAAGYIAPRHMKAIKDTGGQLVACMDKHDSVGVLDSYFPECDLFTEVEIFERYLYKHPVDYLVVCTPNYLHYAHIAMGLHAGCNVICEKPVVLTPESLDSITEIEGKTGKMCYTVLQLREHEEVKKLKGTSAKQIMIEYHTPRGNWYDHSWKSDKKKSGGVTMNIGVHFFDIVTWLFGEPGPVFGKSYDRQAHGCFDAGDTDVEFNLSIDGPARRSLSVDGKEINLSNGFTDLHTKCYESILKGEGVRAIETKPVIQMIHDMTVGEVRTQRI